MNRITHRMCITAAASMIMATGVAPVWAHDGGGGPPIVKTEKRESRAAKRAMARMERDLNRLVARLSANMRDAVQPHMDAMVDLSEAEYTDDDLDSLVKTFEMSLDEAEAAAMSAFNEMAAKRRADLASKSASDKTLAKMDAMIARMQSRLERRAEKLNDRFDDRLGDLFEDYAMVSDDGECSDPSSHPGDDKNGDQPATEEPPAQATPEPAPPAGDS